MKPMESAEWRRYRGHQIVVTRSRVLGLRRYQVWRLGESLGVFRDPVMAERYIDGVLNP